MVIFVRKFSLVSQNLFNFIVFKTINLRQHKGNDHSFGEKHHIYSNSNGIFLLLLQISLSKFSKLEQAIFNSYICAKCVEECEIQIHVVFSLFRKS